LNRRRVLNKRRSRKSRRRRNIILTSMSGSILVKLIDVWLGTRHRFAAQVLIIGLVLWTIVHYNIVILVHTRIALYLITNFTYSDTVYYEFIQYLIIIK
jgi:hypothetical protein